MTLLNTSVIVMGLSVAAMDYTLWFSRRQYGWLILGSIQLFLTSFVFFTIRNQ